MPHFMLSNSGGCYFLSQRVAVLLWASPLMNVKQDSEGM